MKKFILSLGLVLGLCAVSAQAAVFSTNITASAANATFLLFTNRASIYNVILTGPYNALVNMYDCDSVTAPYYGTNYTLNSNLVTVSSFATNIVGTFVGSNGYTNYSTNTGIYTYNTTNTLLQTNALTPLLSFPVAANTFETFNTDALFTRGLTVIVTTNVTITVYYRSAQ